jgi:glycosyltransferase involved in cell wall biosynthesis
MGGSGAVFYEWAEKIARRGHHIDVICQQINNLKENNQTSNIYIHRIKPQIECRGELSRSIKHNLIYITSATIKGSQIIRHKKIDVIHASFFGPAIAGSILSKIHAKPLITTIHHVFPPDYWKKLTGENVSYISSISGPIFERIAITMPADIIHATNNATKEDLIKYNIRSSITVVHNGIDLSSYDNSIFNRDYKNCVVFIGRLVFYKKLDVVISSFKHVIKKIYDAKLIVVGDGPMRSKWEKMVLELGLDQNIEFVGHISEEKKMELLSKCSVLVLPSVVEGFALVVLEAFAMSKPVLVSDIKAYNDIVDEGIDGYILPVHSPYEWSEKIILLLSNKLLCKKMGSRGRLKVENKFNINAKVDEIESCYVKIQSKK